MSKFILVGAGSLNPKSVNVDHIVEVELKISKPLTSGGLTSYSFFFKTLQGDSWCSYREEKLAREGLQDLHDELRRVNGNMC